MTDNIMFSDFLILGAANDRMTRAEPDNPSPPHAPSREQTPGGSKNV